MEDTPVIRRLLLLGVPVLVLIIAISAGLSYYHSFQTVRVVGNSTNTMKLYLSTSKGEGVSYDKNHPVFTTSQPLERRLKKGVYVYVVSSPGKDYLPYTHVIKLGEKPVVLAFPQLDYTEAKLSALEKAEEPAIQAVLHAKWPTQMQSYHLQSGKLYKNGEWFGGVLAPSDGSDVLRVVLHKDEDQWKIVTNPPDIVITHPVYPEIPVDVLTDLNNFQ
jgi:hypothetical protein